MSAPMRREHPADAGYGLVAGIAAGAGRADPVRRVAQGAFAGDDLPGARHPGNRRLLDPVQITVLLVFLSFYIPCVSTFAVMLRSVGRRDAWASVALSVGVALLLAGAVRLIFGGLSMVGG
jgi:hypothetical protein